MNIENYITYLLLEPEGSSCVKIGEVLDISHDKVTRFLSSGKYIGKDLYERAKLSLNPFGGVLSVDDTVIDKPYSQLNDLIRYFYSGKHHRTVRGINLISLVYTDIRGISLPVNFRVYNKKDNKTKNDYFMEMLLELLSLGLMPSLVTADSWYASLENFKFLRKYELSFLFGIEKNRVVSSKRDFYENVNKINISNEGHYTHLKEFDFVKIFQTVDKNIDVRYYVYYRANNLLGVSRNDFIKAHKAHWKIEIFHRVLKQSCNLERFFVRNPDSIKNHIFLAIRAFIRLQSWLDDKIITSLYSIKKDLFRKLKKSIINTYA